MFDGCLIDPVFTGQADGGHLGFLLLQFLADAFRGVPGAFPGKVGGVPQFYRVIVYL